MSYKIIVDSCGELFDDMKADGRFQSVPLELEVDGYHVVDDESFDQLEFIRRVKESRHSPKSSCPSPQRYVEAYLGEAEHVYVVTLSGKLSGSYIHVFDSCSASIGETLIAEKIQESEEAGKSFEEVVAETEKYIKDQQTFFVLEALETLRKNGRLSNLKAWVAGALNIKPVMGATPEGTICQLGQARGMAKALDYMVNEIVKRTKECEKKILSIAHCNCPERAKQVKEKLEKLAKFKDIRIVNTAGVSTMYANNGGVIVAV